MGDPWREKYERHLRSAGWRNTRLALIRLRDNRCERCGKQYDPPGLVVHHRTYERLGRERLSDLEVLCPTCHQQADVERAVQGIERSAAALYNARLSGWAANRYGEHWEDRHPIELDHIAEQFDRWLERRNEY